CLLVCSCQSLYESVVIRRRRRWLWWRPFLVLTARLRALHRSLELLARCICMHLRAPVTALTEERRILAALPGCAAVVVRGRRRCEVEVHAADAVFRFCGHGW